MPHNSKTATIPIIIMTIFNPLRVHSTKAVVNCASNFLITKEKGTTNWSNNQKIKIVINVLLIFSIKIVKSALNSIYEVAIKKPMTTGKNLSGPSITSMITSSISVLVFLTILYSRPITKRAKKLFKI